jgi:flavin reductase (DIM6/NTAB) family NADH-FMN oxidoreductase RutF
VFCASTLSSSTSTILESSSVVVPLRGAGQVDLARLCATSGADRFADTTSWTRLPTGEPHFVAAPVSIRGRIAATCAAGASTLVVVNATHAHHAPTAADARSDALGPLVYHNRTWHQLSELSQLVPAAY